MWENDKQQQIQELMQKTFGFSQFLPGQEPVLADIIARKNVVAIMPTGSGKSLLYQLPALFFQGTVLVVSPLISLMKDQVDSLTQKGICATFVNSTLSNFEKKRIVQNMQSGLYKIIYIAPERLQAPSFQEALCNTKISMIAVDEAHCISQWGHDFRPDYLKIKDIRKLLGFPQTIALTATATKDVRQEIAGKLELESWNDHVEGFDRDNLHFHVYSVAGQKQKIDCIVDIYKKIGKYGIVYAGTRKNVEFITKSIAAKKISIAMYHAGLDDYERTDIQNQFIQGKIPLIAATNAFGMGIDKSDIRFVIHFDIPGNLESYYQEVGRAGRDRQKSDCFLLFNYADTRITRFFIQESHPEPSAVNRLWNYICENQVVPNIAQITEHLKFPSSIQVRHILSMLERTGLVSKARPGDFYVCTPSQEGWDNLNQLIALEQQRKQNDEMKLSQMTGYAYYAGCRRSWILDYFGDVKPHSNCNACDNCNNLASEIEVTGEKLVDVQKALSAVTRLNGKFGKSKIIQVLTGSQSESVKKYDLHKLPTYGTLEHFSQEKVNRLMDSLISSNYLAIRFRDQYPLLCITEQGYEVMMLKQPCLLKDVSWADNQIPVTAKKAKTICKFDEGLYEALSGKRKTLAKELGKPAFVIFSNSTLQEMAQKQPISLDEMLKISGVGKVKLENYGEQFLEVLQTYKSK